MFESPSELIALTVGFGALYLIWGALPNANLGTRRERRQDLRRIRSG